MTTATIDQLVVAQSTAEMIKQMCRAVLPRPPLNSPCACRSVPRLSLSLPDSIVSSLRSIGCPVQTAQSLSDAFLKFCSQVRSSFENIHRQSCQRMASHSTCEISSLDKRLAQITRSFERKYEAQVFRAKTHMINHVQGALRTAQSTKPQFNQEYVPVLEKYFEHNAYPSASDRATLARKSMMTARQIEVWFQNHRNRAKKEGKTLRRLDPDAKVHNLSLESLLRTVPMFIVRPNERKEYSEHPQSIVCSSAEDADETDHEIEPSSDSPVIPDCFPSAIPPPHAFPVAFPPSCGYTPFPKEAEKYNFPAPVWQRRPAKTKAIYSTINLEEFIEDFSAKLVIRDLSLGKQCSRRSRSDQPWYAAICTVAPRAPHPALTRLPRQPKKPLPICIPSVPAPLCHNYPFPLPNSCLRPPAFATTLSDKMPTRRKIAGLPKRLPKHTSISHNLSQQVPSSPPPRSSSVDSRAPSSGYVIKTISEERRPSLSSLSSSSSEDLLSTPVSSMVILPGETPPTPKSPPTLDVANLFDDSDYADSGVLRLVESFPVGPDLP